MREQQSTATAVASGAAASQPPRRPSDTAAAARDSSSTETTTAAGRGTGTATAAGDDPFPRGVLQPAVQPGERFAFCMTNPPFFESLDQAGLNPHTCHGGVWWMLI